MVKIVSPSVLSADFGNLAADVRMLNESRAEWIHIDVMDGVFVPNISFGFPVLKAIRKATDKVLDTHLMITEPERYVERFVKEGSDIVTVHSEATADLRSTLRLIRSCGARAGVSIKPGTAVDTVFPYLDELDMVLVMSVEPGFGGQSFMPGSLDKVRELRAEIERRGLDVLIEIDGGINIANSAEVFGAGCDVLVVGNAVFTDADPKGAIAKILDGK